MKKLIPLVFAVCFLLVTTPVLAWNSYTHKSLWQAAIKDIDLSSCDKSVINKIINTAPVLPDRGGGKSNHNCYPTNCPAMEKVKELILQAKKEKNFCQKMFILGQASHYYTDSKNPAHQTLVSTSCHSRFERGVDKYIKNNFNFPTAIKCIKPSVVLTFNEDNFESLVTGIKKDILSVVR